MMTEIVKYTGPKTTKDKDQNPVELQPGWEKFCALYIKDKENRDECIAGLQLLHDLAFSESDFHTVFSKKYPNPLEKRLGQIAGFNSDLTSEMQKGFRPINAAIATGIMTKWVAHRNAFEAKVDAAKANGKRLPGKELDKEEKLKKIIKATVHALIGKVVEKTAAIEYRKVCSRMAERPGRYYLNNLQQEVFHDKAFLTAEGCINGYDPNIHENFIAYLQSSLRFTPNNVRNEARAKVPKVRTVSLHNQYRGNNKDDDEIGNALPDTREPTPYDAAAESDHQAHNRGIADKLLSVLRPRDKRIVELRLGLDGSPELTFEEIGHRFKLTRERIRQLYNRSIKRIQNRNGVKIEKAKKEGNPTQSLPEPVTPQPVPEADSASVSIPSQPSVLMGAVSAHAATTFKKIPGAIQTYRDLIRHLPDDTEKIARELNTFPAVITAVKGGEVVPSEPMIIHLSRGSFPDDETLASKIELFLADRQNHVGITDNDSARVRSNKLRMRHFGEVTKDTGIVELVGNLGGREFIDNPALLPGERNIFAQMMDVAPENVEEELKRRYLQEGRGRWRDRRGNAPSTFAKTGLG